MTATAPRGLTRSWWTASKRLLVFALASTSITCLLADLYGLSPMKVVTPFIFVPSLFALGVLAICDWHRSDGRLCRSVLLGLTAGLLAAIAYDVFRLPFVYARQWGITAVVPPMHLFKVFPRFGAMILGQPIEQPRYSAAASLLGWGYHFGNGATFGVMYLAMIGDPSRRHWAWAILLAVGLELGMLLTPYPHVFGIAVTPRYVVVTMAAHAIFGVCLGLCAAWLAANVKTDRRSA